MRILLPLLAAFHALLAIGGEPDARKPSPITSTASTRLIERGAVLVEDFEARELDCDALESIRRHIGPLFGPLGDRLPILTWQSRGFPTGLEDGRVEDVQQLFLDRGISPLCNPLATAEKGFRHAWPEAARTMGLA